LSNVNKPPTTIQHSEDDSSTMQQDFDQSAHEPLAKVDVVMDGVVDEASFVHPVRRDDCGHRLALLIPGLLIGIFTFGPNLMMSDSGTQKAKTSASIGLLASFMFVLAGIIGAILNTWKLYPMAVLLQLIAFLTLPN
jgi:hypothetical protein